MRLSFEPIIVGPEHGLGLKGQLFIERRKTTTDSWPIEVDFTRKCILPGNYTSFEIKSEELKSIYDYVDSLLNFGGKTSERMGGTYYKIGCNYDDLAYFVKNNLLFKRSHPNEYKLITSVLYNDADFVNAIVNMVDKVSNDEKKLSLLIQLVDSLMEADPSTVDAVLKSLDRNKKKILQNRTTIDSLIDLRRKIEQMDGNEKEEDWQQLFKEYEWILPYVLPGTRILLHSKANVGNVKMDRDSSEVDFVLQDILTQNLTLVEIKTPSKRLLSPSKYRNDVYAISEELSGAISQILNYKQWLITKHPDLNNNEKYEIFNPTCVVIIGTLKSLYCKDDPSSESSKIQSFELFRQSLSGIIILTYDEIIERIADLTDFLGV